MRSFSAKFNIMIESGDCQRRTRIFNWKNQTDSYEISSGSTLYVLGCLFLTCVNKKLKNEINGKLGKSE